MQCTDWSLCCFSIVCIHASFLTYWYQNKTYNATSLNNMHICVCGAHGRGATIAVGTISVAARQQPKEDWENLHYVAAESHVRMCYYIGFIFPSEQSTRISTIRSPLIAPGWKEKQNTSDGEQRMFSTKSTFKSRHTLSVLFLLFTCFEHLETAKPPL